MKFKPPHMILDINSAKQFTDTLVFWESCVPVNHENAAIKLLHLLL